MPTLQKTLLSFGTFCLFCALLSTLTAEELFPPPTPQPRLIEKILDGHIPSSTTPIAWPEENPLELVFDEHFDPHGLSGQLHSGNVLTDWNSLGQKVGLSAAAIFGAYTLWRQRKKESIEHLISGDPIALDEWMTDHFDQSTTLSHRDTNTLVLQNGTALHNRQGFLEWIKTKGLIGLGGLLWTLSLLWKRRHTTPKSFWDQDSSLHQEIRSLAQKNPLSPWKTFFRSSALLIDHTQTKESQVLQKTFALDHPIPTPPRKGPDLLFFEKIDTHLRSWNNFGALQRTLDESLQKASSKDLEEQIKVYQTAITSLQHLFHHHAAQKKSTLHAPQIARQALSRAQSLSYELYRILRSQKAVLPPSLYEHSFAQVIALFSGSKARYAALAQSPGHYQSAQKAYHAALQQRKNRWDTLLQNHRNRYAQITDRLQGLWANVRDRVVAQDQFSQIKNLLKNTFAKALTTKRQQQIQHLTKDLHQSLTTQSASPFIAQTFHTWQTTRPDHITRYQNTLIAQKEKERLTSLLSQKDALTSERDRLQDELNTLAKNAYTQAEFFEKNRRLGVTDKFTLKYLWKRRSKLGQLTKSRLATLAQNITQTRARYNQSVANDLRHYAKAEAAQRWKNYAGWEAYYRRHPLIHQIEEEMVQKRKSQVEALLTQRQNEIESQIKHLSQYQDQTLQSLATAMVKPAPPQTTSPDITPVLSRWIDQYHQKETERQFFVQATQDLPTIDEAYARQYLIDGHNAYAAQSIKTMQFYSSEKGLSLRNLAQQRGTKKDHDLLASISEQQATLTTQNQAALSATFSPDHLLVSSDDTWITSLGDFPEDTTIYAKPSATLTDKFWYSDPVQKFLFWSHDPATHERVAATIDHLTKGNYSRYHATPEATLGHIVLGIIGADAPGDIRDLSHNAKHWEWSFSHVGETSLNALSLLPIIGGLKGAKHAAKGKKLEKALDQTGTWQKGVVVDKKGRYFKIDEVPHALKVTTRAEELKKFKARTPHRHILKHILRGGVNPAGIPVGFHHYPSRGTRSRIVRSSRSRPDQHGIYQAKVEIKNQKGEWIRKTNPNDPLQDMKSSFFPDSWTQEDVLRAVNDAYDTKVHQRKNLWVGKLKNGMYIGMRLDEKGLIRSAYPLYHR